MYVYAVYNAHYSEPWIEYIFLNEDQANAYADMQNTKYGDNNRKCTAWYVSEYNVIE